MSYSRQSYSRSKSPTRSDNRSKYRRSPPRKPVRENTSLFPTRKEKWDIFREKFKAIEEEISLTYLHYETTPEEHPSYNNDWKEFWNRRYRELLSEQKDPKNYDFKSEWIPFWKKQLLQYKISELEAKKFDLLKKMKLTENSKEDLKKKYSEISKFRNYSDTESREKSYLGENRKRFSSFVDEKFRDNKKLRKSLEREINKPRPSVLKDKEDIDMIDVLRLLTAIENQIGSVGPKINDLLSEALTLEKTSLHFSNKLLIDCDNRVMLETVKEKLIGQLTSGIVEKHHIPVTHKCINSIKYVLSNAEKLIPSKFTVSQKPSSPDILCLGDTDPKIPLLEDLIEFPVFVPGIGSFEKEFLGQQLASSLITYNLSDISESHLESIINDLLGRNETKLSLNSNSLNNFDKGLEKSNLTDILKSFSNQEEFGSRFSELPKEIQNQFINFLKSLDSKSTPIENVLDNNETKILDQTKNASNNSGRLSPFSMRIGRSNPSPKRKKIVQKPSIFTDSDDSSFEEEINNKRKMKINDDNNEKRQAVIMKNQQKITKNKDTKESIFTDSDESDEEEINNKRKMKINDDNNEKRQAVIMKNQQKITKNKDLKEYINKKEDNTCLPSSKVLNETTEIIANIMEQLPMKYITKHNTTSTTEKVESSIECTLANISTISSDNSNYYATQNTAYQNYGNFGYQNQDFNSTNFNQVNMYTTPSATTANVYQAPNNQVNTYQYDYNYSYPNNTGTYDYYQQYPGYYH